MARRAPLGWLLSLFGALERNPGRSIAAVGLVCATAYAGAFLSGVSRGQVMRGDAIQYYAYLRSLVFDGDLDFQNEYEHFYGARDGAASTNVWLTTRTPAGRPANMMSIGPALLWSPLFLMTVAVLRGLSAAGFGPAPDGFSTGLQLSAGLAGVLYATAGAWLSYLSARRFFSGPTAFWATLVAWLSGPAVYYTVISPTYSHATSLFAVSLVTFVWLRGAGRYDGRRAVLLGVTIGVAALVRWQDAIVLILPAWELVAARRAGRLTTGAMIVFGARTGLACAVTVLPQLLAWQAIYGSAFTVPQGTSFMRWTEPAVLSVLFSSRHGLFLWTPALLLAAAGLWWLVRKDRMVGGAAVAVVCVAVYVNAAVSDWWAGEAFGARRFIGYTVIFALGFSALFTRAASLVHLSWIRGAAIALVVYNLLFLVQYQLFMRGYRDLVPYPTTAKQVLIDRLLLPFELLRAWLS